MLGLHRWLVGLGYELGVMVLKFAHNSKADSCLVALGVTCNTATNASCMHRFEKCKIPVGIGLTG